MGDRDIRPASQKEESSRRLAFLVGINCYDDTNIKKLKFCIQDILELEKTLKELGYEEVVCLHDNLKPQSPYFPTRDKVKIELLKICQKAQQNDLLWVHFSCHGTLIETKDNKTESVLITWESQNALLNQQKLSVEERYLSVAQVEKFMKDSLASKRVLTLDACHSGLAFGRDLESPEFIENVYMKAKGFAFIAACTADQKAYEWEEKQHGVFSYYLLEGLSGQPKQRPYENCITFYGLKNYVLNQLRIRGRETNEKQVPTDRFEGIGDFILVDYKEIDAKFLNQILAPLTENHIESMKAAYRACCRRNWHINREKSPIPENLVQILDNLKEMPQREGHYSRTVEFIAYFLVNAEIPDQQVVDQLNKWGEHKTNNFLDLCEKIKNKYKNKNKKVTQKILLKSYLIIKILEIFFQKDKYIFSSWFVCDNPDNQSPKYDKNFSITINEELSLEEITMKIENIFSEMSCRYNYLFYEEKFKLEKPMIVLFLPHSLFNTNFNTWIYESLPIESRYQLVIRSCKRLEKNYSSTYDWNKKWQTLHKKINHPGSDSFIPISEDGKLLFSKLTQENIIGLKLIEPISPENISLLNQTGIPVAIWLKNIPKNVDCEREINEILKKTITELPTEIERKRAEAVDNKNKEKHIGHHLSLLWEYPNLLPPDTDYSIPL